MNIFIVDSFATKIFEGNQAGVVLLDENEVFPSDKIMCQIAAELRHSETAFVKKVAENTFKLRFFTPTEEVDLCGHATIASFHVLKNYGLLDSNLCVAQTHAGNLRVICEENLFWLEMGAGEVVRTLDAQETELLYKSYGLTLQDKPVHLNPVIASTGLHDILMPVKSTHCLNSAVQNKEQVSTFSKSLNVVGVHMFYFENDETTTAYCRNFAPLYGIDEECATGTSTGALTFYLNQLNLIDTNSVNCFIQGEAMGKRSEIFSRFEENSLFVGGNAVISLKATLAI